MLKKLAVSPTSRFLAFTLGQNLFKMALTLNLAEINFHGRQVMLHINRPIIFLDDSMAINIR